MKPNTPRPPHTGPALTPRQQEALSTKRHLSVTANAGSGKTSVLVHRYLRILLEELVPVEQVVVLTYTDKAAGELRRRIADAVLDVPRGPGTAGSGLIGPIREQLPRAWIGTIHSFCARLLREYAVEAGVDAEFTVLEGIDQRMAVAKAIGETVGAILQETTGRELRSKVHTLLRTYGRGWVFRFISILVEQRDQLGRLVGTGGIYSLPDRQAIRRWETALKERLAEALDDPMLASDLQRVCSDAPGTGDGLEVFLKAESPEARGIAFLDLTARMFRKDGKLAATFVGSGALARELAIEASRLRRRQVALAPLLEPLLRPSESRRAHAALLDATRTLLTTTRQAIERYDQMKLAMSRLDYEDLQLRTRALLSNENVRLALAQRFRYIMVDEFQDTNFLQYELLLPLVTGLRTGNLFVVGDPRQSIYGFRHADPAVFDACTEDILRSPTGGAAVVMDESFRPLADIAAFVNLVFPGDDGSGFQPLVCARDNNAAGRVELLLHEESADTVTETDLVARRIVRMLRQGETVYSKDERPRQAIPGDIAILIRSRTVLPELEDALVRHGIPYTVTAGVGFFQTQDFLDFYDYLRFLVNPSDSVALAGILRSPFFHVSDAELFEVALLRGERGLWEFISSTDFPGGKFQDTARAVTVLREDLTLGLRLTPGELIDRIAGETLYEPKLAADERGKQRRANLEKLRQFARATASQRSVNLYDFVERLKVLVEREENEGQEEADSPEDAVRVMTVHAAKGLEFPIVMLPRLHKRFQFDAEPFLDQQYGIGFALPDEEEGERLPPVASLLKERNKEKTIREEKRILYVACTRARDLLVLSGVWDTDRHKVHALNWIVNGLGVDGEKPHGEVERHTTLERLVRVDGRTERIRSSHLARVPVLASTDLVTEEALPEQKAASLRPRPVLRIGPIQPGTPLEEFTGEMLRTYVECPNRYYLRYVLGIPGGSEEAENARFEETVSTLVRHGDVQGVLSLVPSGRLSELLHRDDLERSLPVAMSLPEGILAERLPLLFRDHENVWRDRKSVWILVRFARDLDGAGPTGPDGGEVASGFVRDSYRFLLELDMLLVSQLKDVPEVKGVLFLASRPESPLELVADGEQLELVASRIREVLRAIGNEQFEHRATPCPVCQQGRR